MPNLCIFAGLQFAGNTFCFGANCQNGMHGMQSHTEYKSLERSGVHLSWDGRRMLAPKGLLQDGRYIDLEPFARKHS